MDSSVADSYVRQIKDIDAALSRLNKQVKELRLKKKESENRLYGWMTRHGVEEYKTIKAKKVAPKVRAKRKPAKKKKEDTIRLFSNIGVNDPEALWDELVKTQKAENEEVAQEEEG